MERCIFIEFSDDSEFVKLYKEYNEARWNLQQYLEKEDIKLRVKENSSAVTDEFLPKDNLK